MPGKGYYRKKPVKAKSQKKVSFATKVKKVLVKVSEPKHYNTTQTQDIYHSVVYTKNLISGITTGATFNNRIGDKIHLDAIKLDAWYTYQSTGFPDGQLVRCMVIATEKEQTTSTTWVDSAGTGFQNSMLGYSSGYQDFPSLIVDPKLVTVLVDTTFTMAPAPYIPYYNGVIASSAQVNRMHHMKKTIRFDRDFQFKTGSSYSTRNNIYVLFGVISSSSGTSTSSKVGYLAWNTDLIFKDVDG